MYKFSAPKYPNFGRGGSFRQCPKFRSFFLMASRSKSRSYFDVLVLFVQGKVSKRKRFLTGTVPNIILIDRNLRWKEGPKNFHMILPRLSVMFLVTSIWPLIGQPKDIFVGALTLRANVFALNYRNFQELLQELLKQEFILPGKVLLKKFFDLNH